MTIKPSISICVVAKNAAQTTKRLFDSLKKFADRGGDMVLVDTGSTDGTQDLFRAFGFRVFEEGDRFMQPFPKEVADKINAEANENGDPPIFEDGMKFFHFADARNYAASLAENDFICNPDADEELTVFDIPAIEELAKACNRLSYDFVFSHNPDGTPSVWFRTDTRLSNRKVWFWKGVVHETLSPLTADRKITYVPPHILKIEHYQIPSPTRSNYLAGLSYACDLEPENDRNLHYYGRELFYRGFFRTAIKKLRKHVELSKWDLERGQSLVYVGDCYMALKDEDAAVRAWRQSLDIEPSRREAWVKLAHYYFTKGDVHRTLSHAAAAAALPPVVFYGNSPTTYTYLPDHYLYWAYHKLGNIDKAREHWLRCLSFEPRNEAFIYDSIYFRRT